MSAPGNSRALKFGDAKQDKKTMLCVFDNGQLSTQFQHFLKGAHVVVEMSSKTSRGLFINRLLKETKNAPVRCENDMQPRFCAIKHQDSKSSERVYLLLDVCGRDNDSLFASLMAKSLVFQYFDRALIQHLALVGFPLFSPSVYVLGHSYFIKSPDFSKALFEVPAASTDQTVINSILQDATPDIRCPRHSETKLLPSLPGNNFPGNNFPGNIFAANFAENLPSVMCWCPAEIRSALRAISSLPAKTKTNWCNAFTALAKTLSDLQLLPLNHALSVSNRLEALTRAERNVTSPDPLLQKRISASLSMLRCRCEDAMEIGDDAQPSKFAFAHW